MMMVKIDRTALKMLLLLLLLLLVLYVVDDHLYDHSSLCSYGITRRQRCHLCLRY